jgi:sulfoxide reductase heme-binding subunit YedZ
MTIVSERLYYIRIEQVFGFIALVYWYMALIVTPLQKTFGRRSWIGFLQFSRRALGVSAAYFALLHVGFTIWGQLGGLGQLALLPGRFRVSLMLGAAALVVLTVMAATSFDKVIAFLTFPRWKLVHRLGYPAGIVALLHIWMIGTHTGYSVVGLIAFVMLAILFGLESFRISMAAASRWRLPRKNQIAIFVILWYVFCYSLVLAPQIISSYHSEQHGSDDSGGQHAH